MQISFQNVGRVAAHGALLVAVVAGLGAAARPSTTTPKTSSALQNTPLTVTVTPAMTSQLVESLNRSSGCLGVEQADCSNETKLFFAWFESKQAVRDWYFSDSYQRFLDTIEPSRSTRSEPLANISDDLGPVMIIASIKPVNPTTDCFEKNGQKGVACTFGIEYWTPVAGEFCSGSNCFSPKAFAAMTQNGNQQGIQPSNRGSKSNQGIGGSPNTTNPGGGSGSQGGQGTRGGFGR